MRQDFLMVSPIKGFCVCVNNGNVEDMHPKRGPEYDLSCIPIEVSTNLTVIHIGLPHCAPSPDTPPSSGGCFPCWCEPVYFGFVGHCIWVVSRPYSAYYSMDLKSFPSISKLCVIHPKRVAADITCDRVHDSHEEQEFWMTRLDWVKIRLNQFEMFVEHENCLSIWKQCCSRWKQCWIKTMYK